MKKIFTLSAAVMAASAFAQTTPNIVKVTDQVTKYNDNVVVYTCSSPIFGLKNVAGEDSIGGKMLGASFASALCDATSELGTTFTNGGLQDGSNMFALKTSYTDETTGASFPAGYYYPINASGKEFKLQTETNTQKACGIQNVQKIILYVGGTANSCQPSSNYSKDVPAEYLETGIEYSPDPTKKSCILKDSRYTVALNGKIKALTPNVGGDDSVMVGENKVPLFMVNKDNSYYPTILKDGVPTTDWTTFALDRPVRIEIDFTKPYELAEKIDANRATDETGATAMTFTNWADHDSNYPKGYDIYHERGGYEFNPTLYFNVKNGSWDIAQETAGDPIAWTEEIIIKQNIKKAGYLLGFAIISGNENAKTYYASVDESTEEEEATWKAEAFAAHHAELKAEDDIEKNIFFSWMMQPELRQMIVDHYTNNSIQNIDAVKGNKVMYNLLGQRVNNAKGIVIVNGRKMIIK